MSALLHGVDHRRNIFLTQRVRGRLDHDAQHRLRAALAHEDAPLVAEPLGDGLLRRNDRGVIERGVFVIDLHMLYRKVSAKERRRLAEEVLQKVGLSHRMRHMPTQLSGGQCQRVAIARAIVGNPEIILADEPTGNLDSKMGAEVMELLHQLNKEDGRTIVMVTHNEEQAKQTSRTVRFFDGRQVE